MKPAALMHAFGLLLLVACQLVPGSAEARNDEHERLSARLDQLLTDPRLGTYAAAAAAPARAALARLQEAGRKDRVQWVYITERRIDAARVNAESGYLENRRNELQRENDHLQLALARRDAAQARAELERQRLQAQIRAEEAERLRRDADAARAEGEQAALAAESARAEAAQAKRMARAQANAAALARKEAELAAAVEGGSTTPAKPAKPAKKPASKKK